MIVEEIKRQQDASYKDFKLQVRSNPELAKRDARERLVAAKILSPMERCHLTMRRSDVLKASQSCSGLSWM